MPDVVTPPLPSRLPLPSPPRAPTVWHLALGFSSTCPPPRDQGRESLLSPPSRDRGGDATGKCSRLHSSNCLKQPIPFSREWRWPSDERILSLRSLSLLLESTRCVRQRELDYRSLGGEPGTGKD